MNAISLKPCLDPMTMQLVQELAEDISQFDGISGISEQPLAHLSDRGYQHITVWKNHELAAYAHITLPHAEHPAMVELIVKPEYRQESIASTVISAIKSHYPTAQFWAYGNQPAAQACARKLAAQAARTLLQLRANISQEHFFADAQNSLHSELSIRTYQGTEDDSAILNINNAAFSWHPEQGNWSQEDLDNRFQAPWFDPCGLFLAEKFGKLVGFHWTKIDPIHKPEIGEIYILAVDPSQAGQGIGTILTKAGLAHFQKRKLTQVELWVEADNASALKVYHRQGFSLYRTNVAYALDKNFAN